MFITVTSENNKNLQEYVYCQVGYYLEKWIMYHIKTMYRHTMWHVLIKCDMGGGAAKFR